MSLSGLLKELPTTAFRAGPLSHLFECTGSQGDSLIAESDFRYSLLKAFVDYQASLKVIGSAGSRYLRRR